MSEMVWQGRYLSVRTEGHWEYAERTGAIAAVVIVAVTPAGELLLVEQHRVPAGRICVELPAGLVGDDSDGESVSDAAIRELEEETGYRAGAIEEHGDFYSSPGMTSERFTFVVARDLTRTGDGGGEESEDITVHRVPLGEVRAFVAARRREGRGIDAKLLLVLGGELLPGVG